MSTNTDLEGDLTVPEVAAKLRCSPWTVKRLINAPQGIRASKIAGRWLVSPEDLQAYRDARANRAKPRKRRQRAS